MKFKVFVGALALSTLLVGGKTFEEVDDATVLPSPKYKYTFNVVDHEEQVYQRQTQQLENKVVTGEFSWVDGAGTRHVTVYRADDQGYHILELRTEPGVVTVDPALEERRKGKNHQVEKINRIAFANSRSSKLFETTRSHSGNQIDIQSTSGGNVKPILSGFVSTTTQTPVAPSTTTTSVEDYDVGGQNDGDFYADEQLESSIEEDEHFYDEITESPTTTTSTTSTTTTEKPNNDFTQLPRRKIKIVKRPKFSVPSNRDFKRAGRKPVLIVPVNSEAQKNLFQIPIERFKSSSNDKNPEEEGEDGKGEVESALTNLTILNNRERRPLVGINQPTSTSSPKFVTHPVRLVPITIRNNPIPILQNFHTLI